MCQKREMKDYHMAYDNAENRYVVLTHIISLQLLYI